MENQLRRKLELAECVHHRDGNPTNNDISNLRIVTREEHGSIHGGSFKKKHISPAWNKTSPETINKIFQLYHQGKNYSQVSRDLHISNMVVRRYILGIPSY